MKNTGAVAKAMAQYDKGDPKLINHFIKVTGYAKAIGELEGLDDTTQLILEIAALTHDIGILKSIEKYGKGDGKYQQIEGPPEAEALLRALSVPEGITSRVCWLIAHHHTYDNIQGLDYQILVEADFLVNLYEGSMGHDEIQTVREKIFRTESGLCFLDSLFPQG